MNTQPSLEIPFHPPKEHPGFHMNDWFPLPDEDPVTAYMIAQLWDRTESPSAWEAARLSKAVFLYREKMSGWTVLVKFYTAKVHSQESAIKYAENEFHCTQKAHAFRWQDAAVSAPLPLSHNHGTLFLEYVDGLTLEDTIAIRRNRPGTILPALQKTAQLLARIHSQNPQPEFPRNFHYEITDIRKIVRQLTENGVLKGNPVVEEGLLRLIGCWEEDSSMVDYIPTTIHGDATTSNFIFPWDGGLVAIDWERMYTADPASELGRLLAEIANSISQYGGSYDEAAQLVQFTWKAYIQGLPSDWDTKALHHRTTFYQASSTLRIARNGWLPRLQRTNLVAQALSMLT